MSGPTDERLKQAHNELQLCAASWDPDAKLLGNVTALEIECLMNQSATAQKQLDDVRHQFAFMCLLTLASGAEIVVCDDADPVVVALVEKHKSQTIGECRECGHRAPLKHKPGTHYVLRQMVCAWEGGCRS